MTTDQAVEFVQLVERMRETQKAYFMIRDPELLANAKIAERRVDRVIKQLRYPDLFATATPVDTPNLFPTASPEDTGDATPEKTGEGTPEANPEHTGSGI